jgi:hypothetical protein
MSCCHRNWRFRISKFPRPAVVNRVIFVSTCQTKRATMPVRHNSDNLCTTSQNQIAAHWPANLFARYDEIALQDLVNWKPAFRNA